MHSNLMIQLGSNNQRYMKGWAMIKPYQDKPCQQNMLYKKQIRGKWTWEELKLWKSHQNSGGNYINKYDISYSTNSKLAQIYFLNFPGYINLIYKWLDIKIFNKFYPLKFYLHTNNKNVTIFRILKNEINSKYCTIKNMTNIV